LFGTKNENGFGSSSTAEEIANKYKHNIKDKIFVVTGSNAGIGWETARVLMLNGGKVILACRDTDKAKILLEDLKKHHNDIKYDLLKLDLSSFDSIKEFGKEFNEKYDSLNVLINNAGVMLCPYWKTKEDHEMQFGTNHIGHFLLTNLLFNKLMSTNNPRIINVSSTAHTTPYKNGINFDDIKCEKSYSSMNSYGTSKLSNILFTKELHKRYNSKGLIAISLHPGVIKTELGRHLNKIISSLF